MIAHFDIGRGPWQSIRIASALEALTRANRRILAAARAAGRPFPPLYEAGIRYHNEQNTEDWQTVDELYQSGAGDCEDLASALAAESQERGIMAWPAFYFRQRPNGSRLYHIVVRLPDGRILDPSRRLGMGAE